MIWMITIKPRFAQSILDGDKTIEVRRMIPRSLMSGDTIFVAVSGTGGAVKMAFTVGKTYNVEKTAFWQSHWPVLSLTKPEYAEYLKGVFTAKGIGIQNLRRLSDGYTVEDFGLSRAPQSFSRPKRIPETLMWLFNERADRV